MAKLVLAEDNVFTRDMLARRLERSGHEVVPVGDGRAAIVAAQRHRPDAILMDLNMPVMDGQHAIRILKDDARTFRIPIIVLTAHTEPDQVAEALDAGCFSFEAKPVVFRHLLERIEEAIQASGRRKPAEAPPSEEAGALE
jgi:CheY-like chemotaxis protein